MDEWDDRIIPPPFFLATQRDYIYLLCFEILISSRLKSPTFPFVYLSELLFGLYASLAC